SPDLKALASLRRATLGPGWKTGKETTRLVRTLTHRKILFIVYRAEVGSAAKKSPASDDALWAKEDDLAALPISTAQRAVIDAVREAEIDGQGKLF
ncbi:MAG: hypothetical protein HOE85_03325, partial [Nitrospinaceae bacterium]|nr:hypothetical protein [Nitrospinaceae bacterium]